MRKITIAILLTILATPAKAMDRNEADSLGEISASNVCQAIENGASSQSEAVATAMNNLPPSELQNFLTLVDAIEREGENEISDAYVEGYDRTISTCLSEFNSLP